MSSNNITAIAAIMARLNKINANIANLKGKTRKNMGINSKSIDEQIEKLDHQIFIYGKLMDKADRQGNAKESEKYYKLIEDAKIQKLIKEQEKLLGSSLNIAGGKRNKKSRRNKRRN